MWTEKLRKVYNDCLPEVMKAEGLEGEELWAVGVPFKGFDQKMSEAMMLHPDMQGLGVLVDKQHTRHFRTKEQATMRHVSDSALEMQSSE